MCIQTHTFVFLSPRDFPLTSIALILTKGYGFGMAQINDDKM